MITPENIVKHLNAMLVLDHDFTFEITATYARINGILMPLPENVLIDVVVTNGHIKEFRLVNVK